MAIGNLFGMGGSTLFSRLLGSEETDTTRQCASTTLWLSFIAGLLAAVISSIFKGKWSYFFSSCSRSDFIRHRSCIISN